MASGGVIQVNAALEQRVQNGSHRQLIEDVIWRKIENERLALLDPMWDVQHHYTRELRNRSKESELWLFYEIIARRRIESQRSSGNFSSFDGQQQVADSGSLGSRIGALQSLTSTRNYDGNAEKFNDVIYDILRSRSIQALPYSHHNGVHSTSSEIATYETNDPVALVPAVADHFVETDLTGRDHSIRKNATYNEPLHSKVQTKPSVVLTEGVPQDTAKDTVTVQDLVVVSTDKTTLPQYPGSDIAQGHKEQNTDLLNTNVPSPLQQANYEQLLSEKAKCTPRTVHSVKKFTFYGNLDLRGTRLVSVDWYVFAFWILFLF